MIIYGVTLLAGCYLTGVLLGICSAICSASTPMSEVLYRHADADSAVESSR